MQEKLEKILNLYSNHLHKRFSISPFKCRNSITLGTIVLLFNFRFLSIRCCSFLFYIRHILRLRHWADEIRLKPTSESHWKSFSSLILSFHKKSKSFLKSHFYFYFVKLSYFFIGKNKLQNKIIHDGYLQ